MVHVPDARRLLGKSVTVEVDRTMGSRHFTEFIYPVNYRFLPPTEGPDIDEVSHLQRGDNHAT
ncbi:MAG: hypothetical protein AYK18_17780 [Theionarchaea archaeon DG-70]|nr:MAG: hypothetical protein AYK18_17780 [Theionarchaea archaeon DG-70]